MITPREQWAVQIDVTNACNRRCSNCTRLLSHVTVPFFMSVEKFSRCVAALKNFATDSPPSAADPHKMVGMIGGEPLMHPQFAELAQIMASEIPDREHRGLWTGLEWQKTRHVRLIEDTFGYVNNNRHDSDCLHTPVLVAMQDVVKDEIARDEMIDKCWLQRMWAATCTPKGFFFCEVAGAMDMVFDGPGGLPIEPGCWDRPLEDFRSQIDRWCYRCGVPLNLKGRKDTDEIDDVSHSNLASLLLHHSPRVARGEYVLYTGGKTDASPWRYLR